MTDLWKVAISMTGVFGVTSFVLFGLYREWLKVEALNSLTKAQKFSLLRLFLLLTFFFAITATALVAYQERLKSSKRDSSAIELTTLLESRQKVGNEIFQNIESDYSANESNLVGVQKLKEDYNVVMLGLIQSLEDGNQIIYHEKIKELWYLFDSKKFKTLISVSYRADLITRAYGDGKTFIPPPEAAVTGVHAPSQPTGLRVVK